VTALVICVAVIGVVWKNRVKWFGMETAASVHNACRRNAVVPIRRLSGPATTTAGETGEVVDFNEEAPWVKRGTCILQLTQGRYTEALLGFDTAKTYCALIPAPTVGLFLFQGITLLARMPANQ